MARPWDERDPSLNLPSATALSSSWDPDVARRYGAAAAVEARRKGVDVVLGPTINLHRSPLGGRHFEAFSEDPVLTAELAAAYVHGVQDNGVGATPKHYIVNDSETDRFTVDVRVDDRTLRELYLLAFEKAVTEAHAWLVMSSYNSINGVTGTENELLETPLNSEWGFDGVVISDWTAARSLESAKASQDLVMPGPDGPWGDALVEAVRSGRIDEAVVDRKVARILTLAQRVGALEGSSAAEPVYVQDGLAFARHAAIEGTVLLENRGELPWDRAALRLVAVIGDNAANARTQGGGSATVLPERKVSPLEGLRAALPGVNVTYSSGAIVQQGVVEFPLTKMTNPVTGGPGLRVRFLGDDGTELFTEDRRSSALVWLGGNAPVTTAASVELTTRFTPTESGPVRVGFAAVGHGKVLVDGALIVDEDVQGDADDFAAAVLAPPSTAAETTVTAGTPIDICFEFDMRNRSDQLSGALSLRLGTEPAAIDDDELIADAAHAAALADAAVVVVGTNSLVESEGFDRTSLALPGRQDDLVRAVAAANPHTVVLVNAGSPVLLPWRDDVAALLIGYFGGQEFGDAVADVLLGVAEPGGRLPDHLAGGGGRRTRPVHDPGRRKARVPRGHPHRLPRMAEAGRPTGVLVREWPGLHRDQSRRRRRAALGPGRRIAPDDGRRREPWRAGRQAGGAGLCRAPGLRRRPPGALAGRLRAGLGSGRGEGAGAGQRADPAARLLARRLARRAGRVPAAGWHVRRGPAASRRCDARLMPRIR